MIKDVDVSVVLSTYNRCQLLDGALDSLIRQTYEGITYELVVVDNNSTDNTRELILNAAAQSKVPLHYLFEPRQGLSYGLNSGIAHSTGRVIAFTDDDLRAAPNYVLAIHQAFKDHPEIEFLGGRVMPNWPCRPPVWLTSKHWAPLALQDYGDIPFYTSIDNPIPLVNKAFRRQVFEKRGFLRPDLGKVKEVVGDVADHELMVRIWQAGELGIYMPSVVTYAEVQQERMTKNYHRDWHGSNGRLSALMAIENSHSELFRKKFAGAPVSPYRRLFNAIKGYPSAVFGRVDTGASFYCANRVRYSLNYLREYYYRRLLAFWTQLGL